MFRNLRQIFSKHQLYLIPKENEEKAEIERLAFTLRFWSDQRQLTASASLCTKFVYKVVGLILHTRIEAMSYMQRVGDVRRQCTDRKQ